MVNKSTDNLSSIVQEPELSLRPDLGEQIGYSDVESDGQEESDNLSQPSSAAQLSYVEALESLQSRLGPQLCPEVAQPEPQTGASALVRRLQNLCNRFFPRDI